MAQDITLTMDGMLLNWLKDVGDSVSKGEVIAEFEADKATVEVEAPADGTIVSLSAEVGEEISEGVVIAQLGEAGEAPAGGQKSEPKAEAAPEEAEEAPAEEEAALAGETAPSNGAVAATTPDGRIKASPLAKRVAEEKGIDLSQIAGSGPGGRIVKADVENYKPAAKPAAAPKPVGGTTIGQSYGELPEGDDV